MKTLETLKSLFHHSEQSGKNPAVKDEALPAGQKTEASAGWDPQKVMAIYTLLSLIVSILSFLFKS
jgi:hypothetical protein